MNTSIISKMYQVEGLKKAFGNGNKLYQAEN